MEQQPRIKVPLTATDKVVEFVGLLLFVFLWSFAAWAYTRLPDSIPTHFDGAGKPNDWSGKASIFLLPAVGTFLASVMTGLTRVPHLYNYPTQVTAENAEKLYQLGTGMIRFLKTGLLALFTAITLATYTTASGSTDGLGVLFMPVALGLLFIPLGYYTVKMVKIRKQ